MDTTKECVICYGEGELGHKCPKCKSTICSECIVRYFSSLAEERNLPICTNPVCDHVISLQEVSRSNRGSYLDCIKVYLLSSPDEKVQQKMATIAIVDKIRNEKCLFLQGAMPLAVALTAKLCMGSKMRTLSKENAKKLEKMAEIAAGPSRACFIMACRGRLSKDLVCNLCDSTFCSECEQKKVASHICKKEDVESISELRTSKKCPECNTPVYKYVGCEMMTCTVCKCNFHYSTGEKTKHGNSHNRNLELVEKKYLHQIYKEELDKLGLYEEVVAFEQAFVVRDNYDSLTNALVKLLDNPKHRPTLLAAVKEHEMGRKDQARTKLYGKAIVEMEELIISKKLTKEHIASILSRFQ